MKVLVVGGGGREHALAWALAASPLVTDLHAAPGNAGIAHLACCHPVPATDLDGQVRLAQDLGIDFVVVGPEAPLVAGLADRLKAAGIPAFGPSAAAAQLEGSKGFMKDLAREAGVPTAAYGRFRDAASARAFVDAQGAPIVVKADGLAAGKGVTVAMTIAEAHAAIDDCFAGRFGQAGAEVVVEEFLEGVEASLFALVDGRTARLFGTARDHKRALDGDQGPNTGGMGAISPSPDLTPELEAQVMAQIVQPTVDTMAARGMPYSGVLYAGLMLTRSGPKLIEYNVRFGDPEAQVLVRRLGSDLLPLLRACADGTLATAPLAWKDDIAIGVVVASKAYPESGAKGEPIGNLAAADAMPDVTVFHAGTREADGTILAEGGRVLCVTATGRDAAEARARAYRGVDAIDWPGGYARRDIAIFAV
ncbi:phosphoribosylamine--glycine ligase [Zavarzinia sp. CC-PAN008]|uniref:phosphoribosylamine--glycine ligase n=1 Tax=Zavarzinia sp. CC-PAN008 TaxID=3243332 RepID=UPI003F744822